MTTNKPITSEVAPMIDVVGHPYFAEKALAFLCEHNGVFVTPDATGEFVCCACTARNLFANRIEHYNECPYWAVKVLYDARHQ